MEICGSLALWLWLQAGNHSIESGMLASVRSAKPWEGRGPAGNAWLPRVYRLPVASPSGLFPPDHNGWIDASLEPRWRLGLATEGRLPKRGAAIGGILKDVSLTH